MVRAHLKLPVESLKIEFPHLLERTFNRFISKGCWRNRQKCKLQTGLSQEPAVWDMHRLFVTSASEHWALQSHAKVQLAHLSTSDAQVTDQTTPLLPSSLSFSPRKHPPRQCITLGQSSPGAVDPFPQLKQSHSDLHQWGNLASNVKIHPGIQPLTDILRLEGIKYWSSPTSTGKQMS